MKSIGITREIDSLGRVVLPKELLRKLGISTDTPLQFYLSDDRIILARYENSCMLCNSYDQIITWRNHRICKKCIPEIKNNGTENFNK